MSLIPRLRSELALEIPEPLDEPGVFDAGVGLFNSFATRSLAISGSGHKESYMESSRDVLKNQHTFFQVFHRVINRHNCLQLRLFTAEMARQLTGIRREGDALAINNLTSGLWIKEHLPEGLDLSQLKQVLNHYEINWTEPPFPNLQRESSRYGFAELILTQQDLRKVLFSPLLLTSKLTVQTIAQTLSIEGYLQEWLLNRKQSIAPKGSRLYQPPKQEQLLFFDEQVLTPLLNVIRRATLDSSGISGDSEELLRIVQAADIVGYQLVKYRDELTRREYLVLAEKDDKPLKYWGIYVFRLGEGRPYVVQVPRPLFEVNSFEYGVALFERLQARALMIGTTHPQANFDGSADLINPNNKFSLFNLVSQALLREAHDAELMLVNTRAFAYKADKPASEADVIFSSSEGVVSRGQLGRLPQELLTKLENDGMSVQLIDGSEQTSGYEVGSTAQASYLAATANKSFAILWLSPSVRSAFRQQSENLLQAAQFNAFTIPSVEQDLGVYLQQHRAFRSKVGLDDHFRTLLTHYIAEQDVLRLQQVVDSAADNRYSLLRLIDRNSKQALLLIHDAAGIPLAVANLTAKNQATREVDLTVPLPKQAIDFINQRKAWWYRRAG